MNKKLKILAVMTTLLITGIIITPSLSNQRKCTVGTKKGI